MLAVGDPVLKGGIVLQLIVAAHFKIAEVHLPQPRQDGVGHVAVDGAKGLLRPQHTAGKIPGRGGILGGVGVKLRQRVRQHGDIRRAVIQVVDAALGLAVAQ